MISDHKGFSGKELTVSQDTIRDKSKSLLLLDPLQGKDTTPKASVEFNKLLIQKSEKGFTPLPSVDAERQFPKKVVRSYNPLKTADYLKYGDVYFDISTAGKLFVEQPLYPDEITREKLISLNEFQHKESNYLDRPETPKQQEYTTSQDPVITHRILEKQKNGVDTSLKGSFDWVLGILIFTTIIIGWIRVFYNKRVRGFLDAVMNNQWSKKIFEEKNAVTQRISFVLNLLFIINASLFIFFLLKYFNYKLLGYGDFQTFLIIVFVLIGVYLLKIVILRISGFLVMAQKAFSEYIHNVFIFNKAYGLVIFPVLWILPFVSSDYLIILIYAGIGLFILAFVMRIIRGILNCIRIKLSIFYLILYLCALEIFPLLILYKTITSVM